MERGLSYKYFTSRRDAFILGRLEGRCDNLYINGGSKKVEEREKQTEPTRSTLLNSRAGEKEEDGGRRLPHTSSKRPFLPHVQAQPHCTCLQ